ncbi:MAG: spondin domain-containing protein, partial [Acidimicrobiales bacterium]
MSSEAVMPPSARPRRIPWLLAVIALTLVGALAGPVAPAAAESGTKFTVVIENVSNDGTLTTSEGTVAVPLSPGAYLVRPAGRNSLLDPRDAATPALEALAEDGDPSGFPSQVPGSQVFNTPDGASGPAPIFPGESYTFSFTAEPGDELSLATMFVQSNDWFYSTLSDERGIALFDGSGQPITADVSDQLKLWESKTEVDEPPGTGPNQAPRQSGPNTGETESGQVISLSSQGISVPLNGPVIKVTVTADGAAPPTDGGDPGDGDGSDPGDGDGSDPGDGDGSDPGDGEDPDDARPGEPFDAADGMVVGRTGTLNGLNGINVGPDGKVYNASVGGSEITVHDPETGEILDRIGQERGVNGPDDVFIAPDGTIYWTEILGGSVGMLKPDGTVKKQFVGPGVNPITMSDDGRLFVARVFLGDGLYELDPELEADPVALIPDLMGLNAFDFGPDGLLYGPLFFGGAVVKIDVDAAPPVPETVVTGLNVPSAAKFNSAGELHIAEIGGGRILKADTATGEVEVVTQIEGTIDNLTFDATDRLFFAAGADNQIIRISTDGTIDVFGEIALGLPAGVAVGPDGTVWVGDLFVLRGYGEAADPVASFYDRFAPPGTGFGGATSVYADGDLLVTSTTFGNNVQVFNPATGEVAEDFRNLAGPTNAIMHGDRLVASQLGADPAVGGSVVDARTGDVLLEGLPTPVGLASDGTTLYVSDWATGTVTAVDDAGSSVIASGLSGPEGLAVDGNRLLVVEEGLDQVSAIDLASGEVTAVIVGLDLGPPPIEGFAPFGSVTGVTVDSDGIIYVTQDGETNALLKFGAGSSDPSAPQLGFVDTLAADGRFTTLLTAVNASFLQPPPPGEMFTMLAPTDEAFAALPPDMLEGLLADPGFLTDILLYHLIEGAVPAETVVTLTEAQTLLGAPLGIEVIDGQVVLNGATTVIETDIATTEGLIHVIDGVLQPPPPPEPVGFLVADYARGSTEVPDPGDPDALSLAFVNVFDHGDEGTLEVCVSVSTTIQDPTMVHIHQGAAGVAGPVVVDFGLTSDSWGQDQLNPVQRSADGCVDVAGDLAREIVADPGGYYANVHSEAFPAGANREQFISGEGLNEFPRAFTAAPLRGANVVPGPGDPDSGRGFVDFNLPTTDTGEICYESTVFRVDEITSGHIHVGAAGESGDVLVDLEYGTRWALRTHPSGQG